jgi:hypothetical protein
VSRQDAECWINNTKIQRNDPKWGENGIGIGIVSYQVVSPPAPL